MANLLYCGDNLEILNRHVPDGSADLIYLDPPFNSNATYNVLFTERPGIRSAAQIRAFEDTWHWDEAAELSYRQTVETGPAKVAELVQSLRQVLGASDMMAYLAMMAPRLAELHRVLKRTGSMYLHCDPTAGHYLKLLLDAIFGPANCRNEIVWKRTSAHSSAKRFGPVHDLIFFYSKSDIYTWNPQYHPYDEAYLASHYRNKDANGDSYTLSDLTAAGIRNGSSGRPWHGFEPADKGNHWKFTIEHLEELDARGRIYWPTNGGWPRYKRYLKEQKGVPLQDVWTDIPPINAKAAERLGFPTQKPEALLDRILQAGSNPGDVVLDPFCGCGTAIAVAEKLKRQWIGIDITHLAISLIRRRLADEYGNTMPGYEVINEPKDLGSAQALALQDRFQFQCWVLGMMGARPVSPDEIKGKDRGIDGLLFYFDDNSAVPKKVVVQVKSGHVSSRDVRDLVGVITREKAAAGALLTLKPPTRDMTTEAAAAGFYDWSPMGGEPRRYRRLQILPVEELLEGKKLDLPPNLNLTYKKAPKRNKQDTEQLQFEYGRGRRSAGA